MQQKLKWNAMIRHLPVAEFCPYISSIIYLYHYFTLEYLQISVLN